MGNAFINFYETKTIHWMGIPYQVEKHYGGYFYAVSDMDDEIITGPIEDKILKKYFLFTKKEKR